ncbi:hypothetical protein A4H97_20975 [Niastella yeongjuensis]|uniref:Uncharacterized protein n=1 Tax=Niastella yeongjuensis TaxID=354355 RepID=A0A1V9FCP8_9BACT|nr:hypothetical protein A4H97_20975 [Niastella yeongjuensis]
MFSKYTVIGQIYTAIAQNCTFIYSFMMYPHFYLFSIGINKAILDANIISSFYSLPFGGIFLQKK